jgi:peptidoglycan/LPS O-acetylase OafA/YrhL
VAGLVWSHPVLRFFGRYSYGIYVWHMFVIGWVGRSLFPAARIPALADSPFAGNLLFVAVVLAVTIIVALVSWYVVENPFLQLKRFVPDHHRGTPRAAWTLSRGTVAVGRNPLETP